ECRASVVSPVENSLQSGDSNLRRFKERGLVDGGLAAEVFISNRPVWPVSSQLKSYLQRNERYESRI
ncbi:hypothetical protein MYX75_13445, partial [Acidobacteria bacterium AH-259-A15]|nr:hypothetical protein [Acidobacteria bacterium AH-259-A15]